MSPGTVLLKLPILLLAAILIAGLDCGLHANAQSTQETVTIAVPRNFPPQYLTSKDGIPSGFAIDVMDKVADIADIKVRYEVYDNWSNVFKAVINDRADVIPNVGITARRHPFLDFSPPMETSPIRIFVRKDTSGIHELADLKGNTVGVIRINVGNQIIANIEGVEASYAHDQADLLFMLLTGRVDAIVYPESVIMHLAKSMELDKRIKAVGSPVREIKRAIGVGKNHKELLNHLTKALNVFLASKEFEDTYVKWYGSSKPLWVSPKMAAVMGGSMLSLLFLAGIWRYVVLKRNNMLLAGAVEERARALVKSELQFRTVVENLNEGIWQLDPRGFTTYVNPRMCEMLGYGRDDIEGKHIFNFLNDENAKLVAQQLKRQKQGVSEQYDLEFSTKDRDQINTRVTAAPLYDDEGVYAGSLAGIMDVTIRRLALDELEKSQQSLIEAQAVASMGSWECEISTGEFIWSDEMYRIFERTPFSFVPTYNVFSSSIHPDDRKSVSEAVFNTLETRQPYSIDHRIILPGGSERIIHLQGHLLCDNEGKPTRLIGTAQDITDRKQIEWALRDARDNAEAASKIKDEFMANMSHEIRTPLNGLLGMLQLLDSTTMDAEQKDLTETAISCGGRLTMLLSDILTLSNIQTGGLVMGLETFSIREIEHTVRDVFQDSAKEKNLTLDFEVDPNVPEQLTGDDIKIRQVLFNLVGNAVKFTESGKVTVEASLLDGPLGPAQKRLLISVSDTGIGIPDDLHNKIFETFQQVDGSHTRKYGGTGMGLAIVQKLVFLMGGNIAIESWEGQGTTVNFTVRVGMPRPDENTIKFEYTSEESLPSRVLLAEDDRVNRVMTTRLLEKLGHNVVAVKNGWQAVEALHITDFDLILMDIQMPEMNGLEATAAIRQNVELGEKALVPIVALSAHVIDENREDCLRAGMNDCLSKPMEISTLAEMVKWHGRK